MIKTKLKKHIALVLAMALLMLMCALTFSSCSPRSSTTTLPVTGGDGDGDGSGDGGDVEPNPDGTINVYLVLGKGYTLNNASGESFDELFLENTVLFTATAGTTLPVPDEKSGVKFNGWAKINDSATVFVTTVPNKNNTILTAHYSSSSVTDPDNTDPETPDPEVPVETGEGLYLVLNGSDDTQSGYKLNVNAGHTTGGDGYMSLSKSFSVGDTVQIKHTDGTKYPSDTQGYTLGNDSDITKSNDTFDYFNDGVDTGWKRNDSKDMWKNSTDALVCKVAGTYNIYITIYENGWVSFFAQKT